MAKCCGSTLQIADYAINKEDNQMEIVLTNGQTFSISKDELLAWLGTPPIGKAPVTMSDTKVSNFDINPTTNQLEVVLANGDNFSVSRAELAEWLAPSINSKVNVKPTFTSVEGNNIILHYPDGSTVAINLDSMFNNPGNQHGQTTSPATPTTSGTVTLGNRLLANDGSFLGNLVQ